MLPALTRVFGSRNDRLVKNYTRLVREATALEPSLQGLSDEALRAKTDEFRARLKLAASVDARSVPDEISVRRTPSDRSAARP